jgi:4-hydroxythreonine-4-phosphate dehydrogenase
LLERAPLAALVAITMGDPGGVGPEVALKAACDPRVRAASGPVLVGDAAFLSRLARRLGLRVRLVSIAPGRGPLEVASGAGWLPVIDTGGLRRAPAVGRPGRVGGLAAVGAIREAVRLCLVGRVGGIVTAPVSKQSFALAGQGLVGHTELIAGLTRTKRYAMMMKNRDLRVVLATTHVPLAEVASRITAADLVVKLRLTHQYLTRYAGLRRPRIAVCGLNPHAGEGGKLGREERLVIGPAVMRARRAGIAVEGPLPADSLFGSAGIARYDAVVAMYHDQGIIPVKMGDPGGVVNVTLGIPLVRTSPGHGTAFDIAGQGVASSESMVAAVLECAAMAVASVPGRRRRDKERRSDDR